MSFIPSLYHDWVSLACRRHPGERMISKMYTNPHSGNRLR